MAGILFFLFLLSAPLWIPFGLLLTLIFWIESRTASNSNVLEDMSYHWTNYPSHTGWPVWLGTQKLCHIRPVRFALWYNHEVQHAPIHRNWNIPDFILHIHGLACFFGKHAVGFRAPHFYSSPYRFPNWLLFFLGFGWIWMWFWFETYYKNPSGLCRWIFPREAKT